MNFPVSLSIDVAWGDMDAFGHVNNTVFFRYFESTRVAYLRKIREMGPSEASFATVIAHASCDFLSSVVFPDKLLGETRVSRVGQTSFTMDWQLTSRAQGKVVAKGVAVVVLFDREQGRPRPIPTEIRERIACLEQARS